MNKLIKGIKIIEESRHIWVPFIVETKKFLFWEYDRVSEWRQIILTQDKKLCRFYFNGELLIEGKGNISKFK